MTKVTIKKTIDCYRNYISDLSDKDIGLIANGSLNVWLCDLNLRTGTAEFDLITENFKYDRALSDFYNNRNLSLMSIVSGPGVGYELQLDEEGALQGDPTKMDLDGLVARDYFLEARGEEELDLISRIAALYRPQLLSDAECDIDKAVSAWKDNIDDHDPVDEHSKSIT